MVPSFSLTWTIPTGDPLEFSIARVVGEIMNSTDNVYSANLTSKMDVPGSDRDIFSSTLLILETVNGSTITCGGAIVGDTVVASTDIILSSPPDPPSDLKYNGSVLIETSVDLEWSRPSHTGGVPLMNYSVNASSSSGTLSVSDDREMVSYTPGLVYGEIEVTAINYCGQQSQPASLNIPAEAPPDFIMESISVDLNCLEDSSDWTINWMYAAMKAAGVVYPEVVIAVVVNCTEVPGNAVCPETSGICSSVTASDTSCTVDLTRGMYNISITRTNVIDSRKVENSFDTRRVIVEDYDLDNEDKLSVTVFINDACEDGEYPVTVMFGTTSSGVCDIQRNVSDQDPLRPGQPSTTFSVETSLITLGSYCFIVFLRGVPVNTGRRVDDPDLSPVEIGGITIGAGVGILPMVHVVASIIVLFVIVMKKKKQKGTKRDQDSDTIQRTAHPETGEMYTMVDLNKRNRELEQVGATALYQDPSTIQHQEGPSGDVYAMPQKTGKKKEKEAEAEAEVEEMSEEQKAALYSVPDRKGQKSKSEGLEYAQLDIQPSVKQAPPSKGSTYVDIRY